MDLSIIQILSRICFFLLSAGLGFLFGKIIYERYLKK